MYLGIGSVILIILGIVHGLLVLVTNVFELEDPHLLSKMKVSVPKITKSTNMWRGGVGFHLSHSLGLVVTGSLAWYIGHQFLVNSHSLTLIHVFLLIVSVIYLILSIRYWFILPTIGFSISTICFFVWCLQAVT